MMSLKSFNLYSVLGLSVLFFSVFTWSDNSIYRDTYTYAFKFIFMLVVVFVAVLANNKSKADIISMFGLSVFLCSLIVFTIVNFNTINDLIILGGYVVVCLLYYVMSKSNINPHMYIKKYLIVAGFLFTVSNLFFINEASAYSSGKSQFTGYLINANAFAGLAGLFFLIHLHSFYVSKTNPKKAIHFLSLIILAIYLFLCFSRGAILATSVGVVITLLSLNKKKQLFIVLLLGCLTTLWIAFNSIQLSVNRELFETTGRGAIFNNYLNSLYERYFIYGTGVSIDAGRLKTELSYMDVLLMGGVIGFLGFFVFILRTLYMARVCSDRNTNWVISVYIYILFISLVEGYIANILSLPSMLFYITSALIYRCYVEKRLIPKK